MQLGLAIGLILAGVVGAILLVLNGESVVAADLRLDDYETSWPNHIEVQTAGADLATQVNDQVLELDASIRKDRSTVELLTPAGTPLPDVDALIAQVVSADRQNRAVDPSVNDVAGSLAAVLVDLGRLESEDSADPAEVTQLAEQAVLLRSDLATQTVATATLRSRFVALQPASDRAPSFPLAQWAVAVGLIGAGCAVLGRGARTR